jgi:hypothetical protein
MLQDKPPQHRARLALETGLNFVSGRLRGGLAREDKKKKIKKRKIFLR